MPIAYSYIRFSTAKQALGDSLRRQVELAERYAEKHGLELSEVTFRDLGVSGFKQKNIESGALAAFLAAVKDGKIARGSYLLVEQFDRLSRADVNIALRLLLDLVHNGITVVTLADEKVWDNAAVSDLTTLIISLVYMARANNESVEKQRRIKASWDSKRLAAAGGKILTRECPRWLRVSDDKSAFEPIPERVESIRKVFAMRIDGHGVVSIVRRANAEGWPAPGKGESWHTSLVGRLLKNRALLGEYQPTKNDPNNEGKRIPACDVIQNYYPAVIDEVTFLRAAAVSERHGEFPGRRDVNYRNWLQGLLRCSCGQSFVRKNKGTKPGYPEYGRYYCTARNRGASDCPAVAAREIESAILNVVATVAPQYFDGTARTEELKARLEVLTVDLAAAKQTTARFVEAVGSSTAAIPALLQRLTESEAKVAEIEEQIHRARAELADLSSDTDTVFENIVRAIKDADSVDARAALRENLGRVLDKCVVYPTEGYVQVFVHGIEVPILAPLRPDAMLPSCGENFQMMQIEEHPTVG